jgi:DNA-binding winged helix-turn-helix (wHTH) protein
MQLPGNLAVFEGYVVDRRRWLITHGGEAIPLKRKAFNLLLYLLDHRDQVVHRDTLIEALWGNLIVEEGNVTQQVFLLRKALSKHASGIKIIETIPGRGYRFVPPLEYPSSQSEEEPQHPRVVHPAVRHTSQRRAGFVAVACALFALGGYGLRCWQEYGGLPTHKIFAALQER